MKFRYSVQATIVVLGLATALPAAVYAQTGDANSASSSTSSGDAQFVQDASQAGATEIAASRLALTHSSNPGVKKFARLMISDHMKLAHSLDSVAHEKGLGGPATADSALIGKLQNLDGADFDQTYIQQVAVDGHTKAVALFEKESQSGADPQLKEAATRALPTIRHHLALAQQLAGGAQKSTSS